jgi:septation ring formation regulator EzrA
MTCASGKSGQPVDESSINVNVLPLVAKLQAKSREITDLYLQTLKAIAEMPGEIQKIVDDFAKEKHADVDVVLADINKVGQVLQQDSVAKKARKAEIEEITRQYKKLQEESKELERKTQKVMSRLVEFEQKMAADGTLDLISPVHPVIKVLLD